jgi:hypothetical protein
MEIIKVLKEKIKKELILKSNQTKETIENLKLLIRLNEDSIKLRDEFILPKSEKLKKGINILKKNKKKKVLIF